MEENKNTDQEVKELSLEKMEQVSGGAGFGRKNGNLYCNYCKKITKWENNICLEPAHLNLSKQ